MAQVSPQHIQPLSMAFVGALTVAILLLGITNYLADK